MGYPDVISWWTDHLIWPSNVITTQCYTTQQDNMLSDPHRKWVGHPLIQDCMDHHLDPHGHQRHLHPLKSHEWRLPHRHLRQHHRLKLKLPHHHLNHVNLPHPILTIPIRRGNQVIITITCTIITIISSSSNNKIRISHSIQISITHHPILLPDLPRVDYYYYLMQDHHYHRQVYQLQHQQEVSIIPIWCLRIYHQQSFRNQVSGPFPLKNLMVSHFWLKAAHHQEEDHPLLDLVWVEAEGGAGVNQESAERFMAWNKGMSGVPSVSGKKPAPVLLINHEKVWQQMELWKIMSRMMRRKYIRIIMFQTEQKKEEKKRIANKNFAVHINV